MDGVKVLAVASEFHLSSRQIFRYRGVAVEAIAATLEALLPADGDSQRILVQLCPRCLQESVRRDDVTVMSA
ncbi:MAG: hypothetical protein JO359_15210 [Candidatus Eremiobacteraeota bacterium]|nr:hypothetical protein [Candidatus Eremiobacteraeota bacterium]